MSTTYITIALQHIECGECGVVFGLTDDFVARRKESHATFYCPNGHPRHWPQKSDLEKTRDALALERILRASAEEEARRQRQRVNAEQAVTRAVRGHLTRIKRRVNNGVCPHCTRTFKQLAAHIACKHPEKLESP